jgi:peptidoglycan/LPS O-acetylase OafA/YrhL
MVLSGFLVTRQLEMLEQSERPLRDCYRRWIKRILPPVLVMGVASLLLAYTGPSELRGIRLWDLASSQGFDANLRFRYSNADYFSTAAGTPILQHLWSLGVEAQFHVLWPLVLQAYARRFRIAVALGLAVASMPWMSANASSWSTARIYLGTDTHVFALIAGSLVELLVGRRSELRRWPMQIWTIRITAVCVAAVVIRPQDRATFWDGHQLIALLGCALIVLALRNESVRGAVKANPGSS